MKLPFYKKDKEVKPKKESERKIKTIGKRKKSVIFLWVLLVSSLTFGIYKNFTAIDQHTIHEVEKIETSIIDTNAIENFTKQFVRDYYTWENESEKLEERKDKLHGYLTEELHVLNEDTIRDDIPTNSTVENINIWSVSEEEDNTFSVVYSVRQKITEEKETTFTNSTYRILLHQDEQGNLVITQNPTMWTQPEKSNYSPEQVENDGTVEPATEEEINEFLETFFSSYPTATEQELAYYVKGNVLPPIEKEYVFSELINPVYQAQDNQVKAWVTVKYLDQGTKAMQLSQYELTLEKDTNWLIVE
ncbi:conjugal transfer protein [Virgibacillus sp. NKC19-3]|uniref:conjugal transfer protein n=1 Tax=Virgibacillus saliphilus TaxID=2831674 RepID=UPI001C9BA823|nr:conjugal transfer protein [Virgibacillus sp. NKC19-3]MBY7141786.1 conjugal transfer protein [Virgibacillus sp. NKC19-3]